MLIWQAIVSACVGVLFYLKKTRQFLVGIFRKLFGRGKSSAPDTAKIAAKAESP